VRANVISKVLQLVVVSRRDQEADWVRGGPRGRLVDGRQFLTVFSSSAPRSGDSLTKCKSAPGYTVSRLLADHCKARRVATSHDLVWRMFRANAANNNRRQSVVPSPHERTHPSKLFLPVHRLVPVALVMRVPDGVCYAGRGGAAYAGPGAVMAGVVCRGALGGGAFRACFERFDD
jgi:hypothetical protein